MCPSRSLLSIAFVCALLAACTQQQPIQLGRVAGTVNVSGMLGLEPDAPSTLYRPFNEVKAETDIFRNHPDLPQPY